MSKPVRKLFVVIQPLQYLQALELLNEDEECVLIALWANANSQLHQLIDEKDWHQVVWLEYSGTSMDLIKNRAELHPMMLNLGQFDEVIVSAYYNELMNWVVNYHSGAKRMMLEDGTATLLIDSNTMYSSMKFKLKYTVCRLFGFDISPIDNVTLFSLEREEGFKLPSIASDLVVNEFTRLRAQMCQLEGNDTVYFISSSFINVGMINKAHYIAFLSRVAQKYRDHSLNIILHRFDDEKDFTSLKDIDNVTVSKSSGPIELLFKQLQINPMKVLSAGSGATETLKVIYGIDVEVVLPQIEHFNPEYQQEMLELVQHFQKSYDVSYL